MGLPPMAGRPDQYQSYRIRSPRDITVVAACEQVGCDAWLHGWDTVIDESTDLGKAQAAHIRSGGTERTYREMGVTAEGWTVFRFDSKQRCFAEHRTRPEAYAVVLGDARLHAAGTRVPVLRAHTRPADWVEDMGEQLDTIRAAQERG